MWTTMRTAGLGVMGATEVSGRERDSLSRRLSVRDQADYGWRKELREKQEVEVVNGREQRL